MAYGTPVLGAVYKTNSDSTPTLNLPAHSTGDLLIAIGATVPHASLSTSISSIDQGYVEIGHQAFSATGDLAIYAKIAGASEVAPTMTLSGVPPNFMGYMFAVSGGPASISVASDLVDNSQVKGYTDTSNESSFTNTVTPAVDGDLLIWTTQRAETAWNVAGCTIPQGATMLTTSDTDNNYAGTFGMCLLIAYEVQTTKTTRAEWNQKFTDGVSPTVTAYCMIGAALKAGATTGTATMGRCIYILP